VNLPSFEPQESNYSEVGKTGVAVASMASSIQVGSLLSTAGPSQVKETSIHQQHIPEARSTSCLRLGNNFFLGMGQVPGNPPDYLPVGGATQASLSDFVPFALFAGHRILPGSTTQTNSFPPLNGFDIPQLQSQHANAFLPSAGPPGLVPTALMTAFFDNLFQITNQQFEASIQSRPPHNVMGTIDLPGQICAGGSPITQPDPLLLNFPALIPPITGYSETLLSLRSPHANAGSGLAESVSPPSQAMAFGSGFHRLHPGSGAEQPPPAPHRPIRPHCQP
jgi:hypothetical protein